MSFGLTYDEFMRQLWDKDPFDIDPSSFEILATIRYDPHLSKAVPQQVSDITKDNFFLFPEHIERLKFAFRFFEDALAASGLEHDHTFDINATHIFSQLTTALAEAAATLDQPLKLRLLVSMDGHVRVEIYAAPARANLLDGLDEASSEYDVYVDRTPVLASPFTSFKTTQRDVYNQARAKLPGSAPKEEVVLVNSSGEVMEGSITNIAVRTGGGEWVTPRLTSGCLCGVVRHFLLLKNHVKEGDVLPDSLKVGQEVLLLNGILGVVRGTIRGFV